MKHPLILLVVACVLLSFLSVTEAVLGIPDHVPASTLVVPLFEVGVDQTTHSQDTYAVIYNRRASVSLLIHYEVWDAYGNPTPLRGTFFLGPSRSRPFSLSLLINDPSASDATRDQLKDPLSANSLYRGFMTFDEVNADPGSLRPIDPGYPFGSSNALEGYIYYVRLPEGSSNGLSMLSIEAVPPGTSDLLRGFYQDGDDREEIDADARYSAESLSRSGPVLADPDGALDRVDVRAYVLGSTNGSTRVVLFTFPEGGFCIGTPGCKPGFVRSEWHDEAGGLVSKGPAHLSRIVNVLNLSPSASSRNLSGTVSFEDIPGGWETYAFSMNSASPSFNPALTWDAIFEAFIAP